MIHRIINPLKSNSFFVFGARGTGKSTLIQSLFSKNSYVIDLLDEEIYSLYLLNPKRLEDICISQNYEWIIIDEVQRIPKLLNTVHRMIEHKKQKFVLTGSSSRKLKRGGANLLAGRAFVYNLFPITYLEIKDSFDLISYLSWGSLPKIYDLKSPEERKAYLRAYTLTYIKEEVQLEQVLRKLEPFREFLPIAAQSSGKVINFSKIANEVGVQTQTIQNYFSILEETYIGFFLPHFHRSIRKSQIHAPKFYFFDLGIRRSLESSLDSIPAQGTSYYGELFESFIIQEIFRLNAYFEKDFRLSFFKTKHESEIDLVLSRNKKTILIEIKSSAKIDEREVTKLRAVAKAFGNNVPTYYLSQDKHQVEIQGVRCMPWNRFLESFKELE